MKLYVSIYYENCENLSHPFSGVSGKILNDGYSQLPNKHAARLFVFWKIFPTTRLIRTYTLINFMGKFLPTLVKRVGKIIFYLVPTQLFGTTRLLDFEKVSILHVYSILHDYQAGQSRYLRTLLKTIKICINISYNVF